MKPVFFIAIVAVAMIGVMIPNIFAIIDTATIEGNFSTRNEEEMYVVYVTPSNDDREITFSIYGLKSDFTGSGVIFSETSYLNSGETFQNFYVKFSPSKFGHIDYTIMVTGPGILAKQPIKIYSELPSIVKSEESEAESKAAEQRAAEQRAAEQRAAEQRAAEQRAAEQRAAEQRAAEQRTVHGFSSLSEQRAAEQRAAEKRAAAAEQRAAEAKAAQDLTNFLIIIIAIASILLVVILAKRKNKKSSTPQRANTSTYSPPTPPSANTESSTMFFYECPKCHSADIVNNPDGSVNCPDCGYRG